MLMVSKIKQLFNKELRHYQAAICDTKRIENNQMKMDLLIRILQKNGIEFEGLGGATNRYVAQIDGYAVKFAVDRQGFKDNLMEYSLSSEMQPYVTRSYETNGYILIQKCIRMITPEEWRLRKSEILKILDVLGREYLLGDVGYNDINMANWGVDDDDNLRILDYAYCHRLSEDLFICPACGSLLSYDSNYINLLCTDRANCHEKYSYNVIKSIQGEKIDWDTIEERETASVHIPEGQDSVEVDTDANKLLDSRTIMVRNYEDLTRYRKIKEEESKMTSLDLTDSETLSLLRSLNIAKASGDEEKIKELESELDKRRTKKPEPVRCVIDPEFKERLDADQNEAEEIERQINGQPVKKYSLENLFAMIDANNAKEAEQEQEQEEKEEVAEETVVDEEEEALTIDGYTDARAVDGRVSLTLSEYDDNAPENVYLDEINICRYEGVECNGE